MEVKIKKIDWKKTLDEKMKSLKIKPIDLEKNAEEKISAKISQGNTMIQIKYQ